MKPGIERRGYGAGERVAFDLNAKQVSACREIQQSQHRGREDRLARNAGR